MNRSPFERRAAGNRVAVGLQPKGLPKRSVFGRIGKAGDPTIDITIAAHNGAHIGLAEPRSSFNDGIQNHLQIKSRAADDFRAGRLSPAAVAAPL
jgi:hypothetical protein